MSDQPVSQKAFNRTLKRVYGFYTGAVVLFVIVFAILEQFGMSRSTIGYLFLSATVVLYAAIGIMSPSGINELSNTLRERIWSFLTV